MEAPPGQAEMATQAQYGAVIHEQKDTEIQEKLELDQQKNEDLTENGLGY